MRFCLDIKLTQHELDIVRPADVKATQAHDEGGVLCNSVAILSTEAALLTASAKRVLYCMCREWEAKHRHFVDELGGGHNVETLRYYL
ncbi:hypothetical protein GGR54DRAFT_611533 [Hypoxylon sp. NC1633]|nr:hypothetical protein GGR54DRAFT_611533 [Hypoxylon sp. NC1633]